MSKETFVLNFYSIFDSVPASYGEPFLAVNDGVAVRRFQYIMGQSAMIQNDCKLFKIGQFDTELGKLIPLGNPEFICNYEVNYGEEA